MSKWTAIVDQRTNGHWDGHSFYNRTKSDTSKPVHPDYTTNEGMMGQVELPTVIL